MTLKYFSSRVGGVEKSILKLTSASTKVGVETRAKLGKIMTMFKHLIFATLIPSSF